MHSSISSVLFISRENAFRSLIAEATLRQLGGNRFKVYSCGMPALVAQKPSPWTSLVLQTAGIQGTGLSCKSWAEFAKASAPKMDFVIALDAETTLDHPMWPGQPETALWDYPSLTSKKPGNPKVGAEAMRTLMSLRRRIELLVSLQSKGLGRAELRHDLRDLAYV
jgi:protein-tyrosine-phosphatase